MSLTRFHLALIAGWFTALVALFCVRLALGVPPSLAQGIAWLSLGCIPVIVLLSVFRGAPRQTVAELLYAVESVPNPAKTIERQRSTDATQA